MKIIQTIKAFFIFGLALITLGCSDDNDITPLEVHTAVPTEVMETTVSIDGKVSCLCGVSEVGLAWSKEPESEMTLVAASAVSEEYSVMISGLRSGTLYYVRAYAKRGDETVYGELRNFTSAGIKAATLPFVEQFRGDKFPPANWNTLDKDGDGYNWEQYDNRYFAALSDSYRNKKELTPENYLITPKIEVSGSNPILKWSVGVLDADYYQEHYKVVISETPFTIENAATNGKVVFEETLTADAYRALLERSVNIDEYIGKDIYVAWVHYDCSGLYCMYITDIIIDNN